MWWRWHFEVMVLGGKRKGKRREEGRNRLTSSHVSDARHVPWREVPVESRCKIKRLTQKKNNTNNNAGGTGNKQRAASTHKTLRHALHG